MPRLLTALRDHLVTQDVVRDPRVAGAQPPLWLEPRRGAPAPGEGTGAEVGDPVLAAFRAGGLTPTPARGYARQDIVSFTARSSDAAGSHDLENALRVELAPPPLGRRYDFTMGGLYVIECQLWRALQPAGADDQGFTFTFAFLFETYLS